jgi:hypothetical protein
MAVVARSSSLLVRQTRARTDITNSKMGTLIGLKSTVEQEAQKQEQQKQDAADDSSFGNLAQKKTEAVSEFATRRCCG